MLRWTALCSLLVGCTSIFGLDSPARRGDGGTQDDSALVDVDVMPTDGAVVDALDARLSYIGFAASSSDVSSYTFNSVSLGGVAANRYIIAVAHGRSPNSTWSNATLSLDGVAMTKIVERTAAACMAIFIGPKPTGGSGNFVLAWAGGSTDRRALLAVYSAYDLQSATATATATFDNVNPGTVTLMVPAGGFAVTGVAMSSVPDGTSGTWTGIGQNYYQNIESSIFSGGAAMGTGTSQTHTLNSTDTQTSQVMVSASFR